MSEVVERFNRAGRRLDLARVRSFAELALRVFAALVLPPFLADRAIHPRGVNKNEYPGNLRSGRGQPYRDRVCRLPS